MLTLIIVLTITCGRISYLEPHSIPSGGDWGLQRMGAVFFENTEGSVVEGCTFSRNDGIAVMVSGLISTPFAKKRPVFAIGPWH